jgi:hypothetical protein
LASSSLFQAASPEASSSELRDDDEEDEEAADDEDGFALFDSKKKKVKGDPLLKAARDGALSGTQMDMLLKTEMLKAISGRGRSRHRTRSESSRSRDSSQTSRGEKASGFEGLQRLRREFEKYPSKITKRYVEKVKQRLRVTSTRQVWALVDFSLQILPSFGKMKGLWRTHYGMSQALELLLRGKTQAGAAYLTQMVKAVHQVALDQGDWRTAILMIPEEDPLGRPDFGGDELELKRIHSHRKAIKELRGQTYQNELDEVAAEKPPFVPRPKKEPKGGKDGGRGKAVVAEVAA